MVTSADLATSPHTRVVDGTFRIVAKINGGTPDDAGPLNPPLPKLGDRKLAEFQPADTGQKARNAQDVGSCGGCRPARRVRTPTR